MTDCLESVGPGQVCGQPKPCPFHGTVKARIRCTYPVDNGICPNYQPCPMHDQVEHANMIGSKLKDGVKYDQGKIRWGLLPVHSVEEVARVFTIGAKKYEPWNWAKGMDWTRISDAMQRHFADWMKGNAIDAESGEGRLKNLAQVAWGALVLLEYERLGIGKDDRQGKGSRPEGH